MILDCFDSCFGGVDSVDVWLNELYVDFVGADKLLNNFGVVVI